MRRNIVLVTMIAASSAMGSIPSTEPAKIETVLKQTNIAKFDLLKQMGPQVYVRLQEITFNEKKPLGMRWQAFMAMVRLGEKESLPEVDRALHSRDWFLRDAALKVLPVLDSKKALDASVEALKDSALIVRTSAVLALKQLKAKDAKPQLWQELYSKENFMRKQSLWVRRHIVETLASMAEKGEEGRFVEVLSDDDSSLFPPAIAALEKITGQTLGEPELHPVYKRHLWKKWFESQSKTKI